MKRALTVLMLSVLLAGCDGMADAAHCRTEARQIYKPEGAPTQWPAGAQMYVSDCMAGRGFRPRPVSWCVSNADMTYGGCWEPDSIILDLLRAATSKDEKP